MEYSITEIEHGIEYHPAGTEPGTYVIITYKDDECMGGDAKKQVALDVARWVDAEIEFPNAVQRTITTYYGGWEQPHEV